MPGFGAKPVLRCYRCAILAPSQQVRPGTDEKWRRGRSGYGPPVPATAARESNP
jgi:hypothetical protein